MPKKGSFLRRSNTGCEDIHHSCTVRFLDDAEPITVTFQKSSKGSEIFDFVCSSLNLVEKDCFGLRFVDTDKQRHWLDAARNAYTQLKNVKPLVLCFRVKFYPSDPLKLKEEITKYYIYQQLVRDAHHGRLLCTQVEANQLAAYIVQDEIGDYDEVDLPKDYITKVKMLPKPCQKQEVTIMELHKQLSGKNPSEVEQDFLALASKLATYGVDPYPVRDLVGVQKYLGVTYHGIVTFQGNKRTNLFLWPDITKLDFEGKHFVIQANESEEKNTSITTLPLTKRKKRAHHFKCSSAKACKHLWKCAVEQQYFFTLDSSSSAPKVSAGRGFLRRGSSFRFSGHCQNEAFAESASISREEPRFTRSASNSSLQLRGNTSFESNTLPRGFKPTDILDTSISSCETASRLNTSVQSSESSAAVTAGDTSLTTVGEDVPEIKVSSPVGTGSVPPEARLKTQAEITASLGVGIPAPDEKARDQRLGETAQDLDAQIRELQIELEKCKKTSAAVSGYKRMNGVEKGEKLSVGSEKPSETCSNHVGESTKMSRDAKKRESNILRNVVVSVVVTALVLFLFLFLLFETDLPLISGVRENPEVRHFGENYYRPARRSVFG